VRVSVSVHDVAYKVIGCEKEEKARETNRSSKLMLKSSEYQKRLGSGTGIALQIGTTKEQRFVRGAQNS
jgi:hypothetical protein